MGQHRQYRNCSHLVAYNEARLILYEERLSPSANATIQVRVEEEVDLKLTKYAECTDATPAFVVSEWLVMLFKLTNLLLTGLIIRRSPKSRNQVKSGNESHGTVY